MRKPGIAFVCGACGVGKSSLIPPLRDLLSDTGFVIRDFDETKTPEPLGSREWACAATEQWIEAAVKMANENRQLVICGPAFIRREVLTDLCGGRDLDLTTIFLDASPDTVRRRLLKRYAGKNMETELLTTGKRLADFIHDNVVNCVQLKKLYKDHGYVRVDADALAPASVALEVARILLMRRARVLGIKV